MNQFNVALGKSEDETLRFWKYGEGGNENYLTVIGIGNDGRLCCGDSALGKKAGARAFNVSS